ncbi:MAG: putative signal transduction protein with EAL and GGDEF domain, partial [bacterium]
MKLQRKLFLAIVPALVAAMFSLAWVVYGELRENSESELIRQIDLLENQILNQTNAIVDTAIANARLFANSNLIKRYVRNSDESERYELMQPALLRLFGSYRQSYPLYNEIQLLMPDGYEDTRLADIAKGNLTDEEAEGEFFKSMQASTDEHYVAFVTDTDDGSQVFKIGYRIVLDNVNELWSENASSLFGYLVVTIDIGSIKSFVTRQAIGKSGYMYLSDGNGRIVFHPTQSMIGRRVSSFNELVAFSQEGSNTATVGKEMGNNIRFFVPTGNDVNMTHSIKLHDNLFLISSLPESELVSLSRELAIATAAITAVLIAFTTFFLWVIMRALILMPIAALQRTAIAIGNGKFDETADLTNKRSDEIGELKSAFFNMNTKLSASMQELQQSHTQIEQLAYLDSLTMLPNRRCISNVLQEAIKKCHQKGTSLAVMFLDLDEFKRINDLLGHEIGDELLQEVAERLLRCDTVCDVSAAEPADPSTDVTTKQYHVARLGGDEFVILVLDLLDTNLAAVIAEQVIKALSEPVSLRNQHFTIGCSIGIALYPEHAQDIEGLFKCSDMAMYDVKRNDKNSFRFFDDEIRVQVQATVRIERDLQLALERDELFLVYQPQICAKTSVTIGAEALIRWQHPERGLVSPDSFIKVAEATGLIGPIGKWVINSACAQWRQWMDDGLQPTRISINISPRQFSLYNIVEVVEKALRTNSIPAHCLEIEITESCMMEATDEVIGALQTLRATGVRVAMDDFGTGYSSLSALTTLPIDTLKIDRMFVTDVSNNSDNAHVISAVLCLANDLGLETVAEGVETEQEKLFLIDKGCDILQGFLLSKP